MELDPVLLSRMQFAFVISFHIIFPAFTIGLAAWLATLEGVRLFDRQSALSADLRLLAQDICSVVRHGRGDAASSWPSSSAPTGACWPSAPDRSRGRCWAMRPSLPSCWKQHSSASCSSVATACRPGSTFFSCCMVSLGTMFSSFWILANNSWMQVPLGHTIVDGRIIPADWWAIMPGPIMLVRWPHMLLAAFLTTGHVRGGHRRLVPAAWQGPCRSRA